MLEPTAVACHGVARRVAGLGRVRAGKDGLEAPPRAKGVAVIGPVRVQAGQGRADSGLDPAPGWGRGAGRPSRAGAGGVPVDPPDIDLGAETTPVAAEGRIRLFSGRAPDRAVPLYG